MQTWVVQWLVGLATDCPWWEGAVPFPPASKHFALFSAKAQQESLQGSLLLPTDPAGLRGQSGSKEAGCPGQLVSLNLGPIGAAQVWHPGLHRFTKEEALWAQHVQKYLEGGDF